jgi:hypothetical protein
VDLGSTGDFLVYNDISRTIKTLDPNLLENFKGKYIIKLDLTD